MSKNDFICGSCKRAFKTEQATREHIDTRHRRGGRIGIYQLIGIHGHKAEEDEPTMAELARQASIDRAMGIPNDDEWLLEGNEQ